MENQLIPTGTSSFTLYELEENLRALVNSIDLAEEPVARELVLEEIGRALRTTREKRDAVAAFLRHCDVQQQFADAEIERIQKRKAFIAAVQEELEAYLVKVIVQFAPLDRKGIQRLEGDFSSFRIQKNPDSVSVENANAIPVAFKHVVLTMPAHVWEALLQRVGVGERKTFEARVEKLEFRPNKKAIAAELKAGNQIPGADLKFGDWRLVIT